MAGPPRNPIPSSPSAASRVFAIPELLEEILLMTCELCVDEKFPNARPVFLFELQRVSRSFLGTINGSVEIKRLIFLEPKDNTFCEALLFPDHDALVWWICIMVIPAYGALIDLSRVVTEHHDQGPCLHIALAGHSLRDTDWLDDGKLAASSESTFLPCCYTKEASWRRIKISNSIEGPRPIKVLVQADQEWDRIQPYIGRPSVKWQLKGDETLGEVFELFQRFWRAIDKRREEKRIYDEQFCARTEGTLSEEFAER